MTLADLDLPAPIARAFLRASKTNLPEDWSAFRRSWYETLGTPTNGSIEDFNAALDSAIQLLSERTN